MTSAWNITSLKLRFPTNVGTERGQASFASCICFYILGACVYPYRGRDLISKPVCHWGEPSKQCKLEEMSNILLHLIDARSAWHTGFDAFTLQCLSNQYTIGVSYRIAMNLSLFLEVSFGNPATHS